MAKPTLLLRPGYSRKQSGSSPPNLVGGTIEMPGKEGKAWRIAQATTNLLLNPRLILGGYGWTYANSTHSDDGTLTPLGIPTRRMVATTGATLTYLYQPLPAGSVTAGLAYSGRMLVKASVSGINMRIQITWRDAAGATIQATYGEYTVSVADEWVELKYENAIAPANASGILFLPRFEAAGISAGDVFYVGEPQLEQRAFLTPYADGDMGAGHAWTGAVNASTSTRSEAYISWASYVAEAMGTTEGSIVFRYYEDGLPNTGSSSARYVFTSGSYTNSWVAVYRSYSGSTSRLVFVLMGPTGSGVSISANVIVTEGWVDAVATWSQDMVSIQTRTERGEATPQAPYTLSFSGKSATIGYGGAQNTNEPVEALAVLDRAVSSAEGDALLMQNEWTWASLGGDPSPVYLPEYESSVYIMAPRIYTADINNEVLEDITTLVTSAGGDADIDRAGPKSTFRIEALNPDVVAPRTWVAPYLDIIPEQGDIISAQRGLFELDEPTVTYTAYGDVVASNSGVDIIGVLQRQVLTSARETAAGAPIMATIITELAMAGITRHAMPDDTRTATTPIVTKAGATWLERINQQLAALGMHAIYALPDGRPTSRPQREPRSDTPARVYTIGEDARIVGEVVTRRATSRPFNRIVAIKEDYQTGTALVSIADNDDPEHPWSIPRIGVSSPSTPITSSDAVDQAALDAVAEATLARVSVQETLSLQVLPDPLLAVHDVVEVAGDDRVSGRWAVEKIAEGITSDDPLVRIEARRIITMATAGGA